MLVSGSGKWANSCPSPVAPYSNCKVVLLPLAVAEPMHNADLFRNVSVLLESLLIAC